MYKKNLFLFYAINFFEGLALFVIPIWSFFFAQYIHIGFGLALLITLLPFLISFLFEIPSGAWADRLGRKKILLIGTCLIILGDSIYLFTQNIIFFLGASILIGIGWAISSGNVEAMIHDSLEIEGNTKSFKDIQANAYIFGFIGKAISTGLGGFLFIISPLLPFQATLIIHFILFICIYLLDSPPQHLSSEKSHSLHIQATLKYLQQNKTLLFFIVFLGLESGLGNIYWFTYQPYLHSIGIKIQNIGIIFALISGISAYGSHLIKKLQTNIQPEKIIIFMMFICFMASMLFNIHNIFGLIPIILLAITSGFTMPLGNNYLITHSKNTHKSTVLSIFSFTITLGCFILSTPIGFLKNTYGLETIYLYMPILTGILFICSIIYLPKKGNS